MTPEDIELYKKIIDINTLTSYIDLLLSAKPNTKNQIVFPINVIKIKSNFEALVFAGLARKLYPNHSFYVYDQQFKNQKNYISYRRNTLKLLSDDQKYVSEAIIDIHYVIKYTMSYVNNTNLYLSILKSIADDAQLDISEILELDQEIYDMDAYELSDDSPICIRFELYDANEIMEDVAYKNSQDQTNSLIEYPDAPLHQKIINDDQDDANLNIVTQTFEVKKTTKENRSPTKEAKPFSHRDMVAEGSTAKRSLYK